MHFTGTCKGTRNVLYLKRPRQNPFITFPQLPFAFSRCYTADSSSGGGRRLLLHAPYAIIRKSRQAVRHFRRVCMRASNRWAYPCSGASARSRCDKLALKVCRTPTSGRTKRRQFRDAAVYLNHVLLPY